MRLYEMHFTGFDSAVYVARRDTKQLCRLRRCDHLHAQVAGIAPGLNREMPPLSDKQSLRLDGDLSLPLQAFAPLTHVRHKLLLADGCLQYHPPRVRVSPDLNVQMSGAEHDKPCAAF